ncbi:multimeric flavodoxin WrbA [Desulfitobacterium sp. LBE]|uniref:NADPH-dependent FMN reductase n=2 Tax=root TaxID=1 RepID=B8G0W4_DESHD|nr:MULTISPECIES: flavodoxin family protein [Desulfitobacterium]ACL18383.1 NADPH-dependent FMN reductase [Desulfitobacterium hafniense DCB-2]MEA5023671.1 flavodoxin family protein [Desulfitobacterium hafniense]TWH58689.1 multimeric flavodoxin WrbA [Desulfitobacterium sp. LBE]
MKILGINGSHRKGKNTAALLKLVLEETERLGCSTELLELADLDIKLCIACNVCLKQSRCSVAGDDMAMVEHKLLEADGILLGSPVYWSNVTALMKNFMDRSRYLHITRNLLAGKAGAAVTNAGLLHGGQEATLKIMEGFLQAHGLHIVDARNPNTGIFTIGVVGAMMSGFKEDKAVWRRSGADDELVQATSRQLGRNMVALIQQLSGASKMT